MDLKEEVQGLVMREGANLVGVATPERFEGAMKGHHPLDLVPNAKSIVTFGIALLGRVCEWEELFKESELVPQDVRLDILQNYVYRTVGYDLVNDLLNLIALRLANFLEAQGYRSFFLPATYGQYHREVSAKIPGGRGLFSQRHAAVRAGLGEFGLNNVVVTRQYGPRVRFNSVITEAPLAPDPLLQEKACLGLKCSLCVDNCPGAITVRDGVDPQEVWYDPPSRTDIEACGALRPQHYCFGRCIRICPVGKKGS